MNPSHYIVGVVLVIVLSLTSNARELRPSDHGLTYQQNPFFPAQTEEDARDFFGASTTTPTTMTPTIPLPLAQNISEGTWMDAPSHDGARGGGQKVDHVKMALIVASGVCGLTGIVLLLVSGVVFLLRLQKRRSPASGKGEDEELRIQSATLASNSGSAHANQDNK